VGHEIRNIECSDHYASIEKCYVTIARVQNLLNAEDCSGQGMHSDWRNIVYQRKPCNKQFTAGEEYENPGKDGKME
jgi:hypothetical protein